MIKLPSLKNRLPKSMKDQIGATAIEYAVIAGLIVAVLITAFGALGGGIDVAFEKIVEAMGGAAAGG